MPPDLIDNLRTPFLDTFAPCNSHACLRVSVAFGDLRGHCVLMPAALMSGHHFSISAFCSAPSASGVL